MADYNINAVTRRAVFTGSAGLGPYAFSFEILNQNDVAVYFNSTLLTLTTDYTVTINANGTGSVTIVTGTGVPSTPTVSDTIIIVGSRDIERVTDFVTAGDLRAAALNEQLDSNIIFEQQIDERVDRSLKFPVYDNFTGDNLLPAAATRKEKIFKFDTEGNPSVIDISEITSNAVVGANYINDVFTGDNSTTAFTLSADPGSKNNVQVFIDGVYQVKSTFTLASTTITFSPAPATGAVIECIVGNAVSQAVIGDMATAPVCSVYLNSSQSISNATWTKVQFSAETFDTDNYFDSSTNYRFLPTREGYYQINTNVSTTAASLTQFALAIYKNGSLYKYGPEGTEKKKGMSDIVYCNGSTDYIEIYGYVNASSGQNFFGGSGQPEHSWFSAVLVRG